MLETSPILLVEDSSADADYVRAILSDSPYALTRVDNLSQAVELLLKDSFSLILLDLSLPDSFGLSTLKSIQKVSGGIPILVLTGLDDEQVSTEAVRQGAQDYVLKDGLSKHTLCRSILYAIERRLSEETIRRTEERLRLSVRASGLGTWTVELETGRTICDDQMQAFLGFPPGSDLTSLKFKDLIPLISLVDLKRLLSCSKVSIERGTEFSAEVQICCNDGAVRHLELRGTTFHDAPARLAGVCIDITERKLLQREQHQLASLVESSNDGIIRLSLDGVVLSWNKGAERIYEFSAADMIGQNISKLVPLRLQAELPRITAKLQRDELVVQHTTNRKTKSGKTIDVSLTLSPVRDDDGVMTGISEIVRDTTLHKIKERRLATQYAITAILSQSESLKDAADKILPLIASTLNWDFSALWCANNEQNTLLSVQTWKLPALKTDYSSLPSSLPVFSLDSGIDSTGWAKGEPTWFDRDTSPNDFPTGAFAATMQFQSAVAFPIVKGSQIIGAITLYGKAARERDPDMISMCLNICAQLSQFILTKGAEESEMMALQAEQHLGRAVLENSPIGLARLNRQLEITEANKVFIHQFKLAPTPFSSKKRGMQAIGFLHPELLKVIADGLPAPFSVENLRISLGQSAEIETFFDVTVWPVQDERDQISSVIVVTNNVTERVRAAQQKEDSVATLTHDLKNPLIGSVRALELFLAGELGPLSKQQLEMMTLLRNSNADMLELVGTLLEVYRYEAGATQLRIENVDAHQLVASCFGPMSAQALAKQITLSNGIEPGQIVRGDRIALKRVAMNILDNAIKFAGEDTEIRVCSERGEKYVHLSFENQGSGISESVQKNLFKRFSQAKAGRQIASGTGLGLYLCRQIMEAHKGEITCRSAPEQGTTFTISLPITDVSSDEPDLLWQNEHGSLPGGNSYA